MKGEIYNFILHSDIGTGTTVASKTFFIDWNRIPESRYKLTFSFTSSSLAIATAFDAILYINELGCSNNTTCMAQFGSTALNSGFIGILRNYTIATYLETRLDNANDNSNTSDLSTQGNTRVGARCTNRRRTGKKHNNCAQQQHHH